MAVDNTKLLELVGKTLKEIAPQATGIVYGSRARGDFNVDSDLDILILLPKSMPKSQQIDLRREIHYKFYDLSVELNYEIEFSPLVLSEETFYERKTPFTINVLNEGIRL